jgi:acyl carrier protein
VDDNEPSSVEVGPPAPGVTLRIVDFSGNLVPEGTQGHLQVAGPTVMAGYYNNPSQTAAAFTEDGWFCTGDLGVIRDGCLTITGRAKDEIVVNGVNFTCQQIEAAVEELRGVVPGDTAAVAARRPGAESEELAVFFCAAPESSLELAEIASAIRRRLGLEIGAPPKWLLAISEESIPRTGIGKIQRSVLRQRLEAGEFASERNLAATPESVLMEVPDWFYRVVWRPRKLESRGDRSARPGPAAIVGSQAEFTSRLVARHRESGAEVAIFPAGERTEDYADLAGAAPQRIYFCGSSNPLLSLALMTRTLAEAGLRSELYVLASIATSAEDEAVAAMARTLAQEHGPWDRVRYIALEGQTLESDVATAIAESYSAGKESEIAYRNGKRFVRRLRRADLTRTEPQPPPFRTGGRYLLAGGLGGLGVELSRYLLTEYHARLLIVGRTSLEENAERRAAFESLQFLPGAVTYALCDISDKGCLRAIVQQQEIDWGARLDGAVHLAGVLNERPVLEENAGTLAAALRAKCEGAENMADVLPERALFLAFSSVNSYFGGPGAGAYSAANRALEAFCAKQRSAGRLEAYCYAWSQWEGIGLGRQFEQQKDLTLAAGYRLIGAKEGMQSLLAALARREPHLLIGLNGSNPRIRMHCDMKDIRSQRLEVYCAPVQSEPTASLDRVLDRFSTDAEFVVRSVAHLPRTEAGEIDLQALAANSVRNRASDSASGPQTPMERLVSDLLCDVFRRSSIPMDANFFEIGGHSLLATQVVSRLRKELGIQPPLRLVFNSASIRAMAQELETMQAEVDRIAQDQPIVAPKNVREEQLLESLETLSEAEIDSLLEELSEKGARG